MLYNVSSPLGLFLASLKSRSNNVDQHRHMSCHYQLVLANDNNRSVHHGFPTCKWNAVGLNVKPSMEFRGIPSQELKAPLGSGCLATLTGTTLIGPLKRDREMVHPVTFPFPGCFLLAHQHMDT